MIVTLEERFIKSSDLNVISTLLFSVSTLIERVNKYVIIQIIDNKPQYSTFHELVSLEPRLPVFDILRTSLIS